MKKIAGDMRKIFAFTLGRQLRSGKYLAAVIVVSAVLFLIPVIGMLLASAPGSDAASGTEESLAAPVSCVYVVDETGCQLSGFEMMNTPEGYDGIDWIGKDSLKEARQESRGMSDALILLLETEAGEIHMQLLIPEDSSLEPADCRGLQQQIMDRFSSVLAVTAGADPEMTEIQEAVTETQIMTEAGEAEDSDSLKEILSAVLPYLFLMALYFLVLIYGQQVANHVIMEKSSKLMDTFLTSVHPFSMIFGKVFAIVCSGILQFGCWIAGLALGLTVAVRITGKGEVSAGGMSAPAGSTAWMGEIFSVPGIVLALLLLLSGFLLYCAIASIGGSAAEKQEDLGSTNLLFTMILVVSFVVSLGAGGVSLGSEEAAAPWLYWIPFTSVLTLPGRLILGEVSLSVGVGALAVSLAATVFFLALAAKIYRMMALYKGTPPTPAKLFRMLVKR